MAPADYDNSDDNDDDDLDPFITDDPDNPDMWRVGPIQTRDCTLADRMVTFRIPEGWEMTLRDFNQAEFKISGMAGADVLFVADSFENPAAIAADDLRTYFEVPFGHGIDDDEFNDISAAVRTEDGRIDWKKITLRKDAYRNDPETGRPYADAIILRRICVLPPAHIRMLTVTLSLPLEDDDSDGERNLIRETLDALIHHATDAAQFSETRTRADQIAETPDLVAQWFEDVAAIRLPPTWQRKSDTEDKNGPPLHSYDAPENDEWTFWAQLMPFRARGAEADHVARLVKKFLESLANSTKIKPDVEEFSLFLDPDDPMAGYIRHVSHEIDKNDGVRLQRTSWTIVKGAPEMFVALALHWVVVEEVANRPDIVALTDMIEAEVPNALILPDLAAAIFD
jgi:hypothetical protein